MNLKCGTRLFLVAGKKETKKRRTFVEINFQAFYQNVNK